MDFDRPNNVSFFDFVGGIQLLHGEDTKTVLPVILIGICVTGIVGNLLVLLILMHDFRNGRASEVKALLASLSSTDLLILTLCAPVRAMTYYRQTWTLGNFVCRTADWFQHSLVVAKILTLAATIRTRHNFVSSTSKGVYFSPARIYGALVFIWTVSLIFPIPHMIFASSKPYNDINLCVSETPGCSADFMNMFYKIYPTATFAIPIIFTVAYYTKTLCNNKPTVNHAPNPQLQSKVNLVLLCISGANALMLLPEWGTWTWTRLGHNYNKPPVGFVIFAQVFLYACSSLTPIILLTMYDDMRQGVSTLWFFITCRGSKHVNITRNPKTEGNGAEVGVIAINSQVNCACSSTTQDIDKDVSEKAFPDLEHFWKERRNTTASEEHDPLPWEREGRKKKQLSSV